MVLGSPNYRADQLNLQHLLALYGSSVPHISKYIRQFINRSINHTKYIGYKPYPGRNCSRLRGTTCI